MSWQKRVLVRNKEDDVPFAAPPQFSQEEMAELYEAETYVPLSWLDEFVEVLTEDRIQGPGDISWNMALRRLTDVVKERAS